MQSHYRKEDPLSIELYAKEMIGHSLKEILTEKEYEGITKGSSKAKGEMGQLIEKYYFKYEPNNESRPDFPEAGLELKTTPLKRLSKGELRAKERLVLNIINYLGEHQLELITSSFWKKNQRLLLMFYLYEENKTLFDFVYKLAGIWDYPPADILILRNDYQIIVDKIRRGLAHEISEGDTLYLGACRKGQGGDNDLRKQPFSTIPAPQRAFSLKPKYMNTIIDKWLNNKASLELEPVIKSADQLKGTTFEDIVYKKFRPYLGMNIVDIHHELGLEINPKAKNYYATLSLRIMGVQKAKVEEFEKADVILKTIRVNHNNMPKEDISFPYFKYTEIVKEDWYDSTLRNLLEKRFFFVVYKYDASMKLYLYGVRFWAMPIPHIDGEVRRVWTDTVRAIIGGKADHLPKKSESPFCHVRPHARDSRDTIDAPDSIKLVKKCFWLNSSYIKYQVVDQLACQIGRGSH